MREAETYCAVSMGQELLAAGRDVHHCYEIFGACGDIDACEPLTILSQKHCMSHQVHALCSNACLPMSMTVTCDGPVLEEASAADATNTFWITSDESIDSMRRTGDNLLRDGYPRFHPV